MKNFLIVFLAIVATVFASSNVEATDRGVQRVVVQDQFGRARVVNVQRNNVSRFRFNSRGFNTPNVIQFNNGFNRGFNQFQFNRGFNNGFNSCNGFNRGFNSGFNSNRLLIQRGNFILGF